MVEPYQARRTGTGIQGCLQGQYRSTATECQTCPIGQYHQIYDSQHGVTRWSYREATILSGYIGIYMSNPPFIELNDDGGINWFHKEVASAPGDTTLRACLDMCEKTADCKAVSWSPPYIDGDYVRKNSDTADVWLAQTWDETYSMYKRFRGGTSRDSVQINITNTLPDNKYSNLMFENWDKGHCIVSKKKPEDILSDEDYVTNEHIVAACRLPANGQPADIYLTSPLERCAGYYRRLDSVRSEVSGYTFTAEYRNDDTGSSIVERLDKLACVWQGSLEPSWSSRTREGVQYVCSTNDLATVNSNRECVCQNTQDTKPDHGFWLSCTERNMTNALNCRAHLAHTYTKEVCRLCAEGKFGTGSGSANCTVCSEGKRSNVRRTNCTD